MDIKLKIENKFYILGKAIVFLLLFMLFHYLYDWFPNIIIAIFSGTNESIYQHMKIGFYVYIFLSIIEYVIFRNQIEDKEKFLFSRLLSTFLIPYMSMFFYLIGSMFGDPITILALEAIYSILMCFISVFPVLILEKWYEKFEYNLLVKIVIIILIIISIAEFGVFTFKSPWYDIFEIAY
ncbi:MAG: DUF6512 family protein [Promethearchaeota archaeon]